MIEPLKGFAIVKKKKPQLSHRTNIFDLSQEKEVKVDTDEELVYTLTTIVKKHGKSR